MTTTDYEVDTVTGELVPAESRTLFRTDDPTEVLQAAKTVADALKGALKDGGMVQRIRDNEHVKIDGWQTLGAMLGISAHTVWSRPLANGWEAKAEARTADGRVVGAAEAMCTRDERTWANRDEYALRSMAQTRAMSKALRGPLGFVVTLAGHSATPAEEVDATEAFGPAASTKDEVSVTKAARLLYADDTVDTRPLLERLERDAGGYLPRIVARALMLTAAHRPTPANAPASEGETGEEGSPEDTPSPGSTVPAATGEVTAEPQDPAP